MKIINPYKMKELASKQYAFQDGVADCADLDKLLNECVEEIETESYWEESEFGGYLFCHHCQHMSMRRSKFCPVCGHEMIGNEQRN